MAWNVLNSDLWKRPLVYLSTRSIRLRILRLASFSISRMALSMAELTIARVKSGFSNQKFPSIIYYYFK